MDNKKLISLIWAISETIELDAWSLETIANKLNVDSNEVLDFIDETRECFTEMIELSEDKENPFN